MRNFPKHILSAAFFALANALLLLASSSPAKGQGLSLGAQVTVTELEGRFVTGFVETGSSSPLVLCTLNENSPPFGAKRVSGLTPLCRQRQVDFGAGPKYGVAILVALPGDFHATPKDNIALVLTIFQEDAGFYGDVESCQGQCL
jgi:hypothetical protein